VNKARERQAVEDLQRLYADFPPGDIEDGEVPDFLVRGDAACVGIEVCEYYRPERPLGSHPKEQEALAHHITERATEICIARGATPFWAPVTFEHGVRLRKRDVEPVASAIASAILARDAEVIRNDGQLPPCVSDIVVHPLGPDHAATVSVIGTTWVPAIDVEELTRIIAGKELKLDAYRKKCATTWLLIVVDGFQLSSMTEAPTVLPAMTSAFDRVIVLHDRTTVAILAG
jgi:hypothetical protein